MILYKKTCFNFISIKKARARISFCARAKIIFRGKHYCGSRKAVKYLDDHHLLTIEDEEVEQFTEFYKIIAEELPELGIKTEQANEIAQFKVYMII